MTTINPTSSSIHIPVQQFKSLFHYLNNNCVIGSVKVVAYDPLTMFTESTSGMSVLDIDGSVYVAYLSATIVDGTINIAYNAIKNIDDVCKHPQYLALSAEQKWACMSALAAQVSAIQEVNYLSTLGHALCYIAHNTEDDGTDVYDAARNYAQGVTAVMLDEEILICAALDFSHAMLYDPNAPENGIYARIGNNYTAVAGLSEYETLLRLDDGSYLPTVCAVLCEDGFRSRFNDCLRSVPEFAIHEAYGAKFQLTDDQHLLLSGDCSQVLAPEYSVIVDGPTYTVSPYSEIDTLDLAAHFFQGN